MAMSLLHKVANMSPNTDSGLPNLGVAEAQHSLGLCYEDGVDS